MAVTRNAVIGGGRGRGWPPEGHRWSWQSQKSGVGGKVGNGDIADEFPLVWRETENSAFREGMCTMGGALCGSVP